MPQPDIQSLLVSGYLHDVSIQYKNQSYIADRVFPVIDGASEKSRIAKYLKGGWFRDDAGIRGPGGRARRGGYVASYDSIQAVEYAFASEVPVEARRAAGYDGSPPLKPDQDALEFCADKIDLSKERRVASLVLTGTWSGVAGEDAEGLWAAAGATNTFISDVRARIKTIRSNTGFRPNTLLLSGNTFDTIVDIEGILDRIKYEEKGVVTKDLLADIFHLNEVLIGDAIYSTAKETKAGTEFSAIDVWEKNATKGSAFLFWKPQTPGLKTPSAGYQVRVAYEDRQPRRVTRWEEPAEHQDVYEVAEMTDIVQTGSDLGFLWYDTILT
jgi:hypothetical protein